MNGPLSNPPKTLILTGPTASGKTECALRFATQQGNIEIINADSLLVYRGLNIGTAKPSPTELAQVPHHLIDIRDPDGTYNASDFLKDVSTITQCLAEQNKRALIVGGSPFYLKALLFGIWDAPESSPELRRTLAELSTSLLYDELNEVDPISAQKIGHTDRYRLTRAIEIKRISGKTPSQLQAQMPTHPNPGYELVVLDRPSDQINERIGARTSKMLQMGLVDETKELLKQYPRVRALHSVGYQQVLNFLENTPPAGRKILPGIKGLEDEINLATRQLVKTQRTWFKSLSFAKQILLDQQALELQAIFQSFYG